MKLKQGAILIITTFLMLLTTSSQAGRQGVSFYYGLGLGVIAPTDFDATAAGDIMFGIEEDGWALEGLLFNSIEAGTSNSTIDYSTTGSHLGLAYRTIEKDGSWFKFKASATKLNFEYTGTTPQFQTNGVTYTIGWGMRMGRESRLEFDYNYYKSGDFSDPLHMIFGRYFWGGSEYQGKAF